MKRIVPLFLALVLAPAAWSQDAPGADEANARDLQRLQEDLANLDAELELIEPDDPKAAEFRDRVERLREDVVYLKVEMRRHQERGGTGTGVAYDDVAAVRRDIRDLRDDLDRAFGAGPDPGVARLDYGSRLQVRIEEPLSSETALVEDRFDATLYAPARYEGQVVVPAGAVLRGVVKAVERAERPSKGGRLELEFDRLYLDTVSYDIKARVEEVGQQGPNKAEKAGIGAVLGGVLGGILGGKTGAIVGVVAGGAGAVVGTKGEEAVLPTGTILTVRLEEPLSLPR